MVRKTAVARSHNNEHIWGVNANKNSVRTAETDKTPEIREKQPQLTTTITNNHSFSSFAAQPSSPKSRTLVSLSSFTMLKTADYTPSLIVNSPLREQICLQREQIRNRQKTVLWCPQLFASRSNSFNIIRVPPNQKIEKSWRSYHLPFLVILKHTWTHGRSPNSIPKKCRR